ncbi:hypothetical protein DL89DRAFT_270574 [Linderina pennispora]|uniref:Uncharacterized protein n=1 Tax=Linderina pennispora TaxID=61395 RepID=A0A1Y1VX14_9FUNG|nr:uncharacterized protein DL89DRAFT_270574 [Linderina pennispora]ORX65857.1 hypothetical protein DL89DRAFT_270574 [Linderina pennispora]
MGEATIDKTTYKIVSSEANTATEFAGMHEINVLVPDSDESGSLTLMPNRPKHLVSLVETIEIPESFDAAQQIKNREHPARDQPENMKMQFVPFGFYSAEDYKKMDGKQVEPLSMPTATSEEPAQKKRKVSAGIDTPASPKADKKKAKKEKKHKKAEKSADSGATMTPASSKASKKEKKPRHKKSKADKE